MKSVKVKLMQKVKQLLFKGWSFSRILFLALGILILIESIEGEMWFGIVIGAAFLLMGLFRLGCANGNCYNSSFNEDVKQQNKD